MVELAILLVAMAEKVVMVEILEHLVLAVKAVLVFGMMTVAKAIQGHQDKEVRMVRMV